MCTSSTEDICIEILHKISLRCEPPFALLPDKSLLITDAAIKTLTHIYALNNLSKQELAKALVNFKVTCFGITCLHVSLCIIKFLCLK